MRACDQNSIFSTGGKFCSDYGLLLELHTLTLVARSYALLSHIIYRIVLDKCPWVLAAQALKFEGEWFNYPRTRAHPGCEVRCHGTKSTYIVCSSVLRRGQPDSGESCIMLQSMVGGYTENTEKAQNCQNLEVAGCLPGTIRYRTHCIQIHSILVPLI